MATLVINVSRVPQQVGLILSNGEKSYSRVMARSRAQLQDGATVDPHWLAMNPGVVKITEVQQPAVAQAKTNASKPAVSVATQTATTNTAETVASDTGVE
jgi:hypothetical protein